MAGKMIFRYYTQPTNCPRFNYFNGTDCVPNMYEYCSSLTAQYQIQKNRTDVYVYYDGINNCVVSKVEANDTSEEEVVVIINPYSANNKIQ